MSQEFDTISIKTCKNCGSENISEVSGWCEADGSYDKMPNCSLIFSDEPLKQEVLPVHGVFYCLSCDSLFDDKTAVQLNEAKN
jgi:hypothetical protein